MLVTEIAAVCVRLVQLCHPLVLVSKKSASLLLLSKFLAVWISSGFFKEEQFLEKRLISGQSFASSNTRNV